MTKSKRQPTTKPQAIRRLREARAEREARLLEAWRDKDGRNLGWDGWVRGNHPDVVAIIWQDDEP